VKKILFTFIVLFGIEYSFAAGLATTDCNYINDFVGGRATGMAGAYTAMADDPAGSYYNPAGLVFALDNQISLSVNSYKEKHLIFEKAVSNHDYKQRISSFYPSFFGVIQTLGPFKAAFSIININNEILDQDELFSGIYALDDSGVAFPSSFSINFNITDNTLLACLSLASFVTDDFTVGLTLYGLRRRSELIMNQMIIYDKGQVDNTPYEIINLYQTDNYLGLLGRLGLQYMPINLLSFGLSFGLGNIFSHKRESQYFYKSESSGNDFTELNSNGTSKIINQKNNISYSDDKIPYNLRAGVALFVNEDFIVSFDCIVDLGDQYYQNKVNDTINFALGFEYYFLKTLPVRLGFFTNLANTPEIDKNKTNQDLHVDLYGLSLSFSWETKNSAISLSGFFQKGEGEAQIQGGNVQDTNIWMYSASLTGSAKY